MSSFEVESLLAECAPEAPSGPDLEYDDAFSQMERAAQGKPEQQYGDTVIESEPPDWKEVKTHALDVVARSKDLRAAVLLARAALAEDGLPSFRDALTLIRGYVEQYWTTVHPQLDPDDDNDPTIRANTLNGLCDFMVLGTLREAPLASARGVGRICYRQIALAKGETSLPEGSEEEVLGMASIQSAFTEMDFAQLSATAEAVAESLENARAIEAAMTAQVGAYDTCNLDTLVKELTSINKFLQPKLAERSPGEAPPDVPEANPSEPASATGTEGVAKAAAPAFNGEIRSREDAIRAIDRVCQYFERHEPSSPLPLLLRRAKRLSTKSFLEILKDVSPDAVSQAEALGGASDLLQEYTEPAANDSSHDEPADPPSVSSDDGY